MDFSTSLLNLTAQAVQTFSLLTRFDFPYKLEITTNFSFSSRIGKEDRMTLVLEEEEESISLVLDKEGEPISVEVATDSTMVIIHQEETTTVDGEMASAKTTMFLQGANGLYQMSNK